jgi:hypothetical protein
MLWTLTFGLDEAVGMDRGVGGTGVVSSMEEGAGEGEGDGSGDSTLALGFSCMNL